MRQSLTAAILFNAPPPVFVGQTHQHIMDASRHTAKEDRYGNNSDRSSKTVAAIFLAILSGDDTMKDIAIATGLSLGSIHGHVHRLKNEGRIRIIKSLNNKQPMFIEVVKCPAESS
jgi:hypothetical protein